MEQITFEDTAKELVRQLESTLTRLAIAAESNISTYSLEANAKKLAGKLKASATALAGLPIYKNVKTTDKMYSEETTLSDELFRKYASICKQCNEALTVYTDEGNKFVEVTKGIFVKLYDLPDKEIPPFKVKIEGDMLMAVRGDLYDKLPSGVKDLLNGGENEK